MRVCGCVRDGDRLATKKAVAPSKPITAAIYARVSTDDQNNEMQLTELRAYVKRMGWASIEYTEQASSVKKRVEFERMMDDARLRKIDVVLVWKLDRFARSMLQLIGSIQLLDSYGVRFLCLTQNLDTDSRNPMSRLMLHLMGAFAEFERALIVERTVAGVAQYRRDFDAGKVGTGKERQSRSGKNLAPWRPPCVFDRVKAGKLRAKGASLRQIAKKLGVSFMTVQRALKSPA